MPLPLTNNVTRLLDQRKILYTAFELPAEKISARTTAELLDVPVGIVFKTIVAIREKPGKPILAAIPGNCELDLKALASALKEKKIHLATQDEAEKITGLQVGGISPLALLQKGFQVLIDQSAQKYPEIHISGGQRGLNIRLPVADLATLTKARFASISIEKKTTEEFS